METRVEHQEAAGGPYYVYVSWSSRISIRTGRAAPVYTVSYVEHTDGRPLDRTWGTVLLDHETGFLSDALRAAGYKVRTV